MKGHGNRDTRAVLECGIVRQMLRAGTIRRGRVYFAQCTARGFALVVTVWRARRKP